MCGVSTSQGTRTPLHICPLLQKHLVPFHPRVPASQRPSSHIPTIAIALFMISIFLVFSPGLVLLISAFLTARSDGSVLSSGTFPQLGHPPFFFSILSALVGG